MNQAQVCIHGHFYQPPRADPVTGNIDDEPGAAPYGNWNERILETCYRPNVELRNFSRISFNIGPTLAQWLERHAKDVLQKIALEDALNVMVYGAGNAIAQPFNHSILPLLPRKDKMIQITWGIRAFQHVFGRAPQGMWLPETAADTETLQILQENEIAFTILAPWQVEGAAGSTPYCINLGNGKSITAFVYQGGLSSTMSFDTFATGNADAFAEFYLKPELERNPAARLMMIATDGELYGHHQPFRDKFLSHLLNGAFDHIGVKVVYPALWLKQNPVTGYAKLRENTSWSCHHGVDRWKKECGCTPGSPWKEPLRLALDFLAAEIESVYQETAGRFGFDPIKAELNYIEIILGDKQIDEWLAGLLNTEVNVEDLSTLRAGFQAVYDKQRMFTSCGWFFDDLSRIEPRNNLAYAAHAVYEIEKISGKDYHSPVLKLLERAQDPVHGVNAADLFWTDYQRIKVVAAG